MTQDRKTVSIDEIAISNMFSIEALVQVLINKGIITQEEILLAIKELQKAKNEQVN